MACTLPFSAYSTIPTGSGAPSCGPGQFLRRGLDLFFRKFTHRSFLFDALKVNLHLPRKKPPAKRQTAQMLQISTFVLFPAPFCDVRDQLQRNRLTIWQPDRPLAGFIVRQPVLKLLHRLRARIEAEVLLRCGKLNHIASVPKGGHTPRDPLLGLRDSPADRLSHRL